MKEKIKKILKKDIEQLEETGKKIEERVPLVIAIIKSVFIIIKWVLILIVAIILILGIFRIIIYIAEIPKRVELQKQYEKYAQAEKVYQNCLDKVASLTIWKELPEPKIGEPIRRLWRKSENKYFDGWVESGRPYYNKTEGHWEIAFMKWMMENHNSFCEEFNPDLINLFLILNLKK